MKPNEKWEQIIKDSGADFVYFVDTATLPDDICESYNCAVLFGKALSKEYISNLIAGRKPKHQEFGSTERKMDALAAKLADRLEAEGYKSTAKFKFAALPHKTVALRAGLGFIGKNNLLVTKEYGCAVVLGKLLTTVPFETISAVPKEPQCGDCNICVNACPTKALHGKTWDIDTTRDEMLTRKLCTCCLECMIRCPYTLRYAEGDVIVCRIE